ncbi:PRP4 pre-mRNA processing factor 4 [Musa troglodytarum]|uniref:PRP4 pre-mRNA processing factor 4 n=1 Tax=Musa troglodytarum TaxID=320322 RepID=A0A9E7IAM3_9LILI|nr:PRP4 pre-mRNA processing factor 4 [Musa troglodytarum]
MEESVEHKRRRGGEEGFPEISSPAAKRLRDELLLDDDDAGAGEQDLVSVMKTLEEEISLPSPLPPQSQAAVRLGYLCEASDDELGLPPPPSVPSSSEGGEAPELEASTLADEGGATEAVGFCHMWGLDDEFSRYGWPEEVFGIGSEGRGVAESENGMLFDGGLFEYDDTADCSPADFADIPWRPDTLPAV